MKASREVARRQRVLLVDVTNVTPVHIPYVYRGHRPPRVTLPVQDSGVRLLVQ
jgi:hypothetical protein